MDGQTIILLVLLFLLLLAAYLLYIEGVWPANIIVRRSKRLRYQELLDHSVDAIFVVEVLGRSYRFESLNPAAIKMFASVGISPQGKSIHELKQKMTAAPASVLLQNLAQNLARAQENTLPVQYREYFGTANSYDIQLVPMADDAGLSHFLCFARDITLQAQYEQELQRRAELEARLSGFVESAPGFFYTFRHGADGSNCMPFASDGIEELFGLQPEQVATNISALNLLIHPDDLGRFFAAIASSAVSLQRQSIEFRVLHPERGEIWVESRAMPVAKGDGSLEWSGFMHDITDRKQAEQRLLEAHDFTEGIVNAISDPIFVKDRQHRWLLLNDACCELIGRTREELIGKSDYDYFPKVQADAFWEGDERVFISGQMDVNEEQITASDGATRYIHTKKMPYRLNGSEYLIAVIRDITARRKMENELRSKRESLAEAQRIGQMGSWELDIASGALSWSDEIFRIFEIDQALFGASYEAFLDAIHPEDRDMVHRAFMESVTKNSAYSIDHRLQFPDGRIKYVRECCETRYDCEGSPVLSHGTVQDITEIKLVELRLKETQTKLRELVINREKEREEERKRMAWEMHEELGQILTGLKMNLAGMRSGMAERQYAERKLRDVNSLVDRAVRIVHDIVSDLRPTVLMHGIVAGLEWLVAEYDKHAGLDCTLEISADCGKLPDDELSTLLFRVTEEALEDVIRHPGVSEVKVEWCCDETVTALTIRHNGEVGTHDLTGGLSLRLFGMQERIVASGGKMVVFSDAAHQTNMHIEFERIHSDDTVMSV